MYRSTSEERYRLLLCFLLCREGGTPGTSAAGSNPGNAASVQAQTVVTLPAPTTSAQPSNAGGTGLQPGYMSMNKHPIIPPQGFNPQLFANPTMWDAFPPPWAVPFQAMQCQTPMPQTVCTPSASTQMNPDIRPLSHSSTDYPDMVDPFLSREEDEFRKTEEEASDEKEESGSSTRKKFLPGSHTFQLLECASSKPLKNHSACRQLLDQFPLSAECDTAYPPKLDESLTLIIPESAKRYDRQLSRLQQFSMDALGALAWLHDVLSKEEQVDCTQVVAAVQTALTLLGNAVAQISLERWKALMKHLNKDLRPLAGACYPKRRQWLFGEDFGLKAKNTADNVKALKPFAPKRK